MKPDPDQHEIDLSRAIQEWRTRHRLREDDAVLLLVELFRIHQRHWDAIRSRDLPSREQFRTDLAKLGDACRSLRLEAAEISKNLLTLNQTTRGTGVTRTAAWLAACIGALAGYLIARAWP